MWQFNSCFTHNVLCILPSKIMITLFKGINKGPRRVMFLSHPCPLYSFQHTECPFVRDSLGLMPSSWVSAPHLEKTGGNPNISWVWQWHLHRIYQGCCARCWFVTFKVEDREAWRAEVHGTTKSQIQLSNWTTTTQLSNWTTATTSRGKTTQHFLHPQHGWSPYPFPFLSN